MPQKSKQSSKEKLTNALIEAKLMRDAYFQLKKTLKEKIQIQQALKASEELYKNLVEHAPLAIYYTDDKGRFLGANDRAEKLSGYKRKELEGRKIFPEFKFLSIKEVLRAKKIVDLNKKGIATGPDKLTLKTKKGKNKIINLYTNVIVTENKRIFMRMIEDITDLEQTRKDVVENEYRYRMIALQTGQLLYDLSLDTGKIEWFGAITDMTGYLESEFKKINLKRWERLIHPQDRKHVLKILDSAIKNNEDYLAEYRFRRKDLQYVDVQDRGVFIKREDGKIHLVGVMIDVSAIKQLSRMRSQFVALASHQLRTPMTTIRWNLELLRESIGGQNKNAESILTDMEFASSRMNTLIHDLLNISFLERGVIKIVPESTNIVSLLSDVIEEYSYLAKTKNINLSFNSSSASYRVKVDQRLFSRAIGNIIENAIKYSDPDTKVRVVLKKIKAGYKITVSDKGIGIPKKDHPFVYDKFFRSANANKYDTGGSGLGLPVSKEILSRAGCDISFRSKINEGTTFSIIIPSRGMKPVQGSETII